MTSTAKAIYFLSPINLSETQEMGSQARPFVHCPAPQTPGSKYELHSAAAFSPL